MNIDSGKNSWVKVVIVTVVIIALACAGLVTWRMMDSVGANIKSDKYQAVFLTNGQVYFCKLHDITEKYVTCNDIYYLQVQQAVQPADKKDTSQQQQVSLAKLGSELHGPEDAMYINRDQVLFWENLKDDGKVVTAIHQNQQKK